MAHAGGPYFVVSVGSLYCFIGQLRVALLRRNRYAWWRVIEVLVFGNVAVGLGSLCSISCQYCHAVWESSLETPPTPPSSAHPP